MDSGSKSLNPNPNPDDVQIEHTELPGRGCLVLRTRGFNTATINGLRRTMLLNTPCYGFTTEIDPNDYKIITGNKEERRNTVLVCTLNSQSIPVLAHRCSRLAIHTDEVTRPLLESNYERKVFFVVCQPPTGQDDDMKALMSKPLMGDKLTHSIHTQDLIPVVLVREDGEDDDTQTYNYAYDVEQSKVVKDHLKRIFQYNELIAEIHHGQKLNIILQPVLGTGAQNIRWAPCTFKYRFSMDPAWANTGHSVVDNGQVRRKIEGERSFKHLFTHKPPDDIAQSSSLDQPYNRLGKPYGHILAFQYNGKMNEVDVFKTCVRTLLDAVDLFYKRYIAADTEESMMSKDSSTIVSDDSTLHSNVELLYIPKNTQDKMPDEDYILTDHTIGNMITTKMLEIVDSIIESKGLEVDDMWRQTHIAYKIPHPLVKQCIMMIKIPEKLDITHTKLITETVESIKLDLNRIFDAVAAHGLDRV